MRKLAAVLTALLIAVAGLEVAPSAASAGAPAKVSSAKRRARKSKKRARKRKKRARVKRRRVRVCRRVRKRRRCRYVYVSAAKASQPTPPRPPAPSYPNKPEAPGAPAGYGPFSIGATNAIRAMRGTGPYLCNEVVGIDGPSCAGGGDIGDGELVWLAKMEMGANQLWVRAGDSRRGFPAAHAAALDRLRAYAHSQGVNIFCWDVPNFWDVRADAERLADMAPHCDAVASDLESGSDGISSLPWANVPMGGGYAGPQLQTDKGKRWTIAYGGWVRYYLAAKYGVGANGGDYPVIVITMQPQTHMSYPFSEAMWFANVISPMDYRGVTWFNNNNPNQGEVARAGNPFVATSVDVIRSYPGWTANHDIMISGMAYSGTGLTAAPNQITGDATSAKNKGAIGVGWFVWQNIRNAGWQPAVAWAAGLGW